MQDAGGVNSGLGVPPWGAWTGVCRGLAQRQEGREDAPEK
jgi:hypothetical protein